MERIDKQCHICGLFESIFSAWQKFSQVMTHTNEQVWVCYGDWVNLDPNGDGQLRDPLEETD